METTSESVVPAAAPRLNNNPVWLTLNAGPEGSARTLTSTLLGSPASDVTASLPAYTPGDNCGNPTVALRMPSVLLAPAGTVSHEVSEVTFVVKLTGPPPPRFITNNGCSAGTPESAMPL